MYAKLWEDRELDQVVRRLPITKTPLVFTIKDDETERFVMEISESPTTGFVFAMVYLDGQHVASYNIIPDGAISG